MEDKCLCLIHLCVFLVLQGYIINVSLVIQWMMNEWMSFANSQIPTLKHLDGSPHPPYLWSLPYFLKYIESPSAHWVQRAPGGSQMQKCKIFKGRVNGGVIHSIWYPCQECMDRQNTISHLNIWRCISIVIIISVNIYWALTICPVLLQIPYMY